MEPSKFTSHMEFEKDIRSDKDEEKRKAFVNLIAEIIVDISIKEYQEEKSRQELK